MQRGRGPKLAGTDTRYWCSVTSQGWKSILECWGSSQRAAHLLDMESMVCAPCASRYQCILREKHNLPQLMICKHCSHRITSSQTTSQFITSAVRVFLKKYLYLQLKLCHSREDANHVILWDQVHQSHHKCLACQQLHKSQS